MPTIRRAEPGADPRPLLELAGARLAEGRLVGIPTETVYGLAADPAVPGALDRLFAAKHRPADMPIAWLIPRRGWETLPGIGDHPPALALGRRYWPGPLTLVVPTGSGDRGYRMPDHPLALALLEFLDRPLAVTSANRSGHPPAGSATEAAAALGEVAALYLDGDPPAGGVASTVVRVHRQELDILREGAVSGRELTGEY